MIIQFSKLPILNIFLLAYKKREMLSRKYSEQQDNVW